MESDSGSTTGPDHDPAASTEAVPPSAPPAGLPSSGEPADTDGMEAYRGLQVRLSLATALAIVLATPLTVWGFGPAAGISLLLGGVAGLLYLQLLSRSVTRLGVESRSLGRIQLLVPVVLVLLISRIPALQIVPALVGFLLYKPAVFLQALRET